jgi:hypothetical protein
MNIIVVHTAKLHLASTVCQTHQSLVFALILTINNSLFACRPINHIKRVNLSISGRLGVKMCQNHTAAPCTAATGREFNFVFFAKQMNCRFLHVCIKLRTARLHKATYCTSAPGSQKYLQMMCSPRT